MTRLRYEYELHLPLKDNHGRRYPVAWLRNVASSLTQEFGGVTEFRYSLKGAWRAGPVEYHDDLHMLRVFASNRRQARRYLRTLKQRIETQWKQRAILVIERDIVML